MCFPDRQSIRATYRWVPLPPSEPTVLSEGKAYKYYSYPLAHTHTHTYSPALLPLTMYALQGQRLLLTPAPLPLNIHQQALNAVSSINARLNTMSSIDTSISSRLDAVLNSSWPISPLTETNSPNCTAALAGV